MAAVHVPLTCSRWRWGGWWVDTQGARCRGRKRPRAQRCSARRGACDHGSRLARVASIHVTRIWREALR
eukprot:5738214-Prymnesium_polylepis.1